MLNRKRVLGDDEVDGANGFAAEVTATKEDDFVAQDLAGETPLGGGSQRLGAGTEAVEAHSVDLDLYCKNCYNDARPMLRTLLLFVVLDFNFAIVCGQSTDSPTAPTLPPPAPVTMTPPSPKTPLIHGPKIFGVRPGSPFLYTIPATGDRPMSFSADHLPSGLTLNADNGQITGSIGQAGIFDVTFRAKNALGASDRPFKIVVGEDITLTPPMGWNSWNCWSTGINQEKILRSARAFIKAGLDQHGWTYINMDDGWQGARGGEFNAIQPRPKAFPNIKAMCDEIHGLGLKVGIYSTPWVTSYAGRIGGSSNNPNGAWDSKTMTTGPKNQKIYPFAIGQYRFFSNDAKQWAAWGIDYLKYDWNPNEMPETKEMADALRASGRDVVYSISNQTPFTSVAALAPLTNAWRVSGDIGDSWKSILKHGFQQDQWAPFARPGHWNDPDMFEIGANGGGKPKQLTPDEQYTHVSQWCLVSAPLMLGCDLDYLDPFTIGLLSNDEVIDVDQDELGKQATSVAKQGELVVYAKPLVDGSKAVGLFNLGPAKAPVTVKWSDLGLSGKQSVRDLWRQQDVGAFDESYTAEVASHGVVLIRVIPAKP